ncbi:10696_t:CDS:2, partial [Cetraspora pellucida]
NIDWNLFITFSNNDLEDINLSFILSYSKSSNKNLDDINFSPPSDNEENNSQVNTSFFLSLFESNNNCSFFADDFVNSDFVNRDSVNGDSVKNNFVNANMNSSEYSSNYENINTSGYQYSLHNDILVKLDEVVNNSPVLTSLELLTKDKKNRFEIAFSTAKTAINIALKMKSDNESIQILKNFILTKQNSRNKNDNLESVENNQDNNDIITLQQDLIEQTNDPYVTKI